VGTKRGDSIYTIAVSLKWKHMLYEAVWRLKEEFI